MPLTNEPLQLNWLAAQLDDQKAVLGRLMRSLMGFAPKTSLKPAQNKKLLSLFVQIADEQEKESALIYRIEEIEKKHRFARKQGKLLKTADAKLAPMPKPVEEPKREGLSLLWAIILWKLVLGPKNDQK